MADWPSTTTKPNAYCELVSTSDEYDSPLNCTVIMPVVCSTMLPSPPKHDARVREEHRQEQQIFDVSVQSMGFDPPQRHTKTHAFIQHQFG
jgi:hypothetical protein